MYLFCVDFRALCSWLFFLYFQGITAPLLCAYIVFFYDIVEFFFLFDVSVGSYPIRGNHPAVRIKRIRLPVNPADRIMPVCVTTQQIPPASILQKPTLKVFARYPAVRGLDPRIAVGKAFINWLHTLILGVALACVCTFWSCSYDK